MVRVRPAFAAQATDVLQRRYPAIRALTERLAAPLSAEDSCVQSMPDASPAKWHLAHTSWFFETFLLKPSLAGYREFQPQYAVLFNSYYHAVGAMHPRPQRGLLTRPPLAEVLAYRRHVDAAMQDLIGGNGLPGDAQALIELGLNHEQQHQELLPTRACRPRPRRPRSPGSRGRRGGMNSARRAKASASTTSCRGTRSGCIPMPSPRVR
jgi:hypothetical protein